MKYLDEEIAKLEKEQQNPQILNESSINSAINDIEHTEEEKWKAEDITKGVKRGSLDIDALQLEFARLNVMKTGLSIHFPKDFFVCTLETDEHMVFSNEEHEINVIFNWIEVKEKFSMKHMKDSMLQQFHAMEMPISWVEDDTVNHGLLEPHYCLFTNNVANGVVFNYLCFVEKGKHQLIINVNGSDRQRNLWKWITEGMISSLEVDSK
ncbi:hypothetical protein [Paenibacillus polymyxa]|uniref:hypothetical protein n=1 Tax=Paenibacillus polymyxa TaxID=1406 RepID=UPI00234B36FC|nr:hypothetical protein [Paenibacillus polymyxa]WCM60085.1 hypothetical protein OYT09_19070 [Paenibacillus polymyxa]